MTTPTTLPRILLMLQLIMAAVMLGLPGAQAITHCAKQCAGDMAVNLGCASTDLACACNTGGFDLTPCEISCTVRGQWDSSDYSICDTATSPKRATPARRARQEKHVAVGESKVEREAVPVPTWSPLSCTAWGVTCAKHDEDAAEAEPQPSAQPSASAVVPEPPTERDAAPVPTWSPLSCTAWGVTCAENDEQAAESKAESAAQADTSKQPTEREAAPAPSWSPLSCTAWGVTCAKHNLTAPQDVVPSATTLVKLTAAATSNAVPVTTSNATPTERDTNNETSSGSGLFARFISALRSVAGRNAAAEPTWSPLSCTAWGVTCANSDVASQAAASSASATGAPAV